MAVLWEDTQPRHSCMPAAGGDPSSFADKSRRSVPPKHSSFRVLLLVAVKGGHVHKCGDYLESFGGSTDVLFIDGSGDVDISDIVVFEALLVKVSEGRYSAVLM